MLTVNDVYKALQELAPLHWRMDGDNVGLLVGAPDAPVTKVLTALDVTDEVIREARETGAELIAAHHPLFFELKSVRADDLTGRKVLALAGNGIAAICMHTNLDAAFGGVNDALAEAVGLRDTGLLCVDGTDSGTEYGIGRVGTVDETALSDFLPRLAKALGANGLRYVDAGRPVRRVAVVGGSGGSDLHKAVSQGCDTFVTADVKYHVFLEAKERGVNLIDAGHFPTENVVVEPLRRFLAERFPELSVNISSVHRQAEQFFV